MEGVDLHTEQKKIGRPSSFKQEVADKICEGLSQGMSLRAVSRQEDMPSIPTILLWMSQNSSFLEQYTRAKEVGIELLAEELIEIADDATNDYMERKNSDGSVEMVIDQENIQRSRLRIDTRKWALSKILPKKYGDRVEVANTGNITVLVNRQINQLTDDSKTIDITPDDS